MLKRIYVNNFRCLVNFELTFDNINLILGYNGSGKSTLFDIFSKLQQFIIEDEKVDRVFKHEDLTRWQKSFVQTFELEFVHKNNIYVYSLAIQCSSNHDSLKIKKESLTFNQEVSAEFNLDAEEDNLSTGKLNIYNINTRLKDHVFAVSANRSLCSYVNSDDNVSVASIFKKRLADCFIAGINPYKINAESRTEENKPNKDLSNFSAWYSHLSQSEQGKIIKLTLELQKVLTGFDSFQNTKIGNARVLSALFNKPSKASYQFDELSEGQKVLIALYTLLYCTPDENCTLMIDEPGNFLALPEIQPWLSKLIDRCQEDNVQAILISHHPSLINALATEYGYWFERKDNQAVRVQKIVDEGEEGGLSIAKLIEMKWIYDQ